MKTIEEIIALKGKTTSLGELYGEIDATKAAVEVKNITDVCDILGIKYEIKGHLGGWVIKFTDTDGDCVLHEGSYGKETNTFETMGLDGDEGDVTGWLTPKEVIKKVLNSIKEEQNVF